MRWTELKRESHVRLSCGCEGFVKSIHFENDPLLSGFMLIHTVKDCAKRVSCEELYQTGQAPSQAFFNASLAEDAMPAEIVPVPLWWRQIQSDKTNPEFKL